MGALGFFNSEFRIQNYVDVRLFIYSEIIGSS